MQEFWNDRYSIGEMVYGTKLNEFFREQLKERNPGRLLLPAEGEGRNAVHAALEGWDVLAFDFSEAGRSKALQLADQRGVKIDYKLAEANQYAGEPESFDAIALIYAHFPPALRQDIHRKTIQWLKPGGVVILEAFHPKHLAYASGGPKDKAMLYTADLLQADFKKLTFSLLKELEITPEEGAYHHGAGYVTRMVATKPD